MEFPILSFMTFVPLLGMIVVMLLKKESVNIIRWTSAFFSFIPLAASYFLLTNYDYSTSAIQFIERYTWFPQVNINYFMGADGLSVPMLFLTALLSFISIIVSFSIKERVKE